MDDMAKDLKRLFSAVMNEADSVMSFVNYDKGLAFSKDELHTRQERVDACSNYEVGIIDQGIFQVKQLTDERYNEFHDFLEKHKTNLGDIEVYYLSKNLVQPASPVTFVYPFVNMYHTAVGFIFKDKQLQIYKQEAMKTTAANDEKTGEESNRCKKTLKKTKGISKKNDAPKKQKKLQID